MMSENQSSKETPACSHAVRNACQSWTDNPPETTNRIGDVVLIRHATRDDVAALKRLLDDHREVFGYIVAAAIREACDQRHILVAEHDGCLIGMVRYRHRRRDTVTTLYDLVVAPAYRLQGIGRALCAALIMECRNLQRSSILARCPVDLPAQAFYRRTGWVEVGQEPGRRRPLVLWQWIWSTDVMVRAESSPDSQSNR